jgi:hypothetical protein
MPQFGYHGTQSVLRSQGCARGYAAEDGTAEDLPDAEIGEHQRGFFLGTGGGSDTCRIGHFVPSSLSPSALASLRSHSEMEVSPAFFRAASNHSNWSVVARNPGRCGISSKPVGRRPFAITDRFNIDQIFVI